MANLSSVSKTPIPSSSHKSVLLHEWWLIKVEQESKLGIGGFANRETLGSRGRRLFGSASSFGKRCSISLNKESQTGNYVFHSAAIGKRLGNNILESVDGITITIVGCLHRPRTLSYGFPPQVCDHFLLGFPFNWEAYSNLSFHDKCERSFPVSLNDLPVTRARDILLSTARESEACAFTSMIVEDLLKQCSKDSVDQSVSSETKLGHKESGKIIEETCEINSLLFDLHKEDLGNSVETEAARVLNQVTRTPSKYSLRSKKMKL